MASRRERLRRREGPITVSIERPAPLGYCVADDCRLPADRKVALPELHTEPALCRIHAGAVDRQIARNLRHKTETELGLK